MFQSLNNQKGIALIMAIVLLLLVGGLAAALLTAGSFNIRFGVDEVERSQAFYSADAGIEYIRDIVENKNLSFNELHDIDDNNNEVLSSDFDPVEHDNDRLHFKIELDSLDATNQSISFKSTGYSSGEEAVVKIDFSSSDFTIPYESPFSIRRYFGDGVYNNSDQTHNIKLSLNVTDGRLSSLEVTDNGGHNDNDLDQLTDWVIDNQSISYSVENPPEELSSIPETTLDDFKTAMLYLMDLAYIDESLEERIIGSPDVNQEILNSYFSYYEYDWDAFIQGSIDLTTGDSIEKTGGTINNQLIYVDNDSLYKLNQNEIVDSILVFSGDVDYAGFSGLDIINSLIVVQGDLVLNGAPNGELTNSQFFVEGNIELEGQTKDWSIPDDDLTGETTVKVFEFSNWRNQ